MKVDMAGAGTVIGAMHAIASNEIPKHVIGLIPATDNRPSEMHTRLVMLLLCLTNLLLKY